MLKEMAKMKIYEGPPDDHQEYQAPIDIPNEEEREEAARTLALLKELIHDRWDLRHLKWFRPQMRMLIGRAKDMSHGL